MSLEKSSSAFVLDNWYVVGLSADIAAAPLARRICNLPMLFYRTETGQVVALADRCAHRGMPLSKGERSGDNIRCIYHGLEFNSAGACVKIPGQERIPASLRVRSYPIVEKDALVWVWTGDAAKADPTLIVSHPYHTDPAWVWTRGAIEVKAHQPVCFPGPAAPSRCAGRASRVPPGCISMSGPARADHATAFVVTGAMDTAMTAKCPFSDSLSFPFKRDRGHPLDPPPEFGIFRRERPVSQVTLWDGSKVWLITRYNDAQEVLGDVRFSSVPSQPGYPLISPAVVATKRGDPSFLRMHPPKHTEHRRMWTPFFAVKRIQEMRPRIQRIIDAAIDEMLAKTPPGDLVQDFALVVPSLVICELLDVPYSEHEFFQRHSKTIFAIDATAEQVAEARAAIAEFWRQMIDAREKKPGDDLVSQVIVNEVGSGRLSKNELVAMVSLMLAAGHETTANMIALGVVTLLQHPDQLNAIKADPTLTPAAVEELLRYLAVAQNGLGRAATEDIEVGGQLIRKGEGVLVLLAAANRDETVFENPDAFDIRRQPHRHTSFGAAIHQCIGSPLARAELQMAFDTLFRRVPTLRLAAPPEDIRYKFDSLFFGVYALPVSW